MLMWTRLKRASLLDRDVFAHVLVQENLGVGDPPHLVGTLVMSEDEWLAMTPCLVGLGHTVVDEERIP
jgi:hypothetical protein